MPQETPPQPSVGAWLSPLLNWCAQMAIDPFTVLVPGAAALVQRAGLCADSARYVNSERLAKGLVLVLPGIEGAGFRAMGIRQGLCSLPAAAPVVNWAGLLPGIWFVFSPRLQRRGLNRLLGMIRRYREEFPGRPVVLVGHSGGAAMAVNVAEVLGSTDPLAGIVCMSTPLHPDYDLSAALAGVRCGIVSCHSSHDLQLAAMVAVGGNFDRQFGATAGHVGFRWQHPRLRQIAWDRSMIGAGHWGGHTGWASRAWIEQHIAPIVADWLDETPRLPG